uniref:Regulator of G-protein signaling 1 n=1 Tax=Amphilophus citrinellus TaxID=61819 RepID=A0A3Q0SML3_AMPCI
MCSLSQKEPFQSPCSWIVNSSEHEKTNLKKEKHPGYTIFACVYTVLPYFYLSLPAGQIAFREFLKSEYSEENILFWLACEEYKKIKTVPEMISSANRIYSEFVQTEAPRQINIDCGTRENITKNISQPTLTSFDTAQKLVYSLMARDCYPRFLKSDIYQGLLRRNDSSVSCQEDSQDKAGETDYIDTQSLQFLYIW